MVLIVETTDDDLGITLSFNTKAAFYFLRECDKHLFLMGAK